MKFFEESDGKKIIASQTSFTDKIHAALLIFEHADSPDGIGSLIDSDKKKEIKKLIDEIYSYLLDESFKTNQSLKDKIGEKINNISNDSEYKNFKKNIRNILDSLASENENFARFKENKKNKSKIKDQENDFLKIFASPGGKSYEKSFIGFKKISKSTQKRNNKNKTDFSKHSNPWLIKNSKNIEFETHSFISKIWSQEENQISKIRKTKDKTLHAVKFFPNSATFSNLMINLHKKNEINEFKFSNQSLDNLVFGEIFHNDLGQHNGNIVAEYNENNIDLKLIDFEKINFYGSFDRNIFEKDFFTRWFLKDFRGNFDDNFFLKKIINHINENNIDFQALDKNSILSKINDFEISFSMNEMNDFNRKNYRSYEFKKLKEDITEHILKISDLFSIEKIKDIVDKNYESLSEIYQIKYKNSSEMSEIEKLKKAIFFLAPGDNFLLNIEGELYDEEFHNKYINNNLALYARDRSKGPIIQDMSESFLVIQNDLEKRTEWAGREDIEANRSNYETLNDKDKEDFLKNILEKEINLSKEYLANFIQAYEFAKKFQQTYAQPGQINESLKRIKEQIFQKPEKLGLKTGWEKRNLIKMQDKFQKYIKFLDEKLRFSPESFINPNIDNQKELIELKKDVSSYIFKRDLPGLASKIASSLILGGASSYMLHKFKPEAQIYKVAFLGAACFGIGLICTNLITIYLDKRAEKLPESAINHDEIQEARDSSRGK